MNEGNPIRRAIRQRADLGRWTLPLVIALASLRSLQADDPPAAAPSSALGGTANAFRTWSRPMPTKTRVKPVAKNRLPLNAAAKRALYTQRIKLLAQGQKLREQGKKAEAIKVGQQMLELSRKLNATSDLVVFDLDWLAWRQVEAEDLESARRSLEEALPIVTKRHGKNDYRTADVRRSIEEVEVRASLSPEDRHELIEADLAAHWAADSSVKPPDALTYAQRAYDLRRKLLGPEHPRTAQSARRLGESFEELKQYAEAEPYLQESVRTRLRILGDAHPDTASSLSALGHLKERQHDDVQAAEYYRQAIDVRAKLDRDESAEAGTDWHKVALFYYRKPNYEQAAIAARRAIAIREKSLGAEHRRTADSLLLLGLSESWLDHLPEAKSLMARALAIYKSKLGDTHADTVTALIDLANVEEKRGEPINAERHFREALDARRKVLGEEHAATAAIYTDLGWLYLVTGMYSKAEPLLQRAVDIEKKVLGENHIQTAVGISRLARLYVHLGDDAKAESLYQKAFEIERRERPQGLQSARLMEQMVLFYLRRNDLRRAEQLCLDAITIKRRMMSEESLELHASLEWLESVYVAKKEYDKARDVLEHILEIEQRSLGDDHPSVAHVLSLAADLYHRMNDDSKSAALLARELAINQKLCPGDHPQTARTLYEIGFLQHFLGDNIHAEPKLRDALEMCQRLEQQNFGVLAERQQLALEQQRRRYLDVYLSTTDDLQSSAAETYRFVLTGKGAVTASQLLARLERRRPELAPLADELLQVGTQLAHLSFSTPEPKERGVWLKQISELTDRKDRLERDLAEKSSRFRRARQANFIESEELRKAIPQHVALVDILWYRHYFSRKPGEKSAQRSEERYVAFVLRRDSEIKRVELGAGEPIVRDFQRWRTDYGSQEEGAAVGQELRNRIWKPLEPHLAGAETVLLSPDGAFCSFPLGALPGARPNSYLIEERNIVFVPVPQLLLQSATTGMSPRHHKDGELPLLLGAVDFDADPGNASLSEHWTAAWTAQGRTAVRGTDANQAAFDPLPGTGEEIEGIADIYRRTFKGLEPTKLTGAGANEQTVRLEAPKHPWIHLATHGFFSPATVQAAGKNRQRGGERILGRSIDSVEELRGVHPSLMSGVALAGANRGFHRGGRGAGKSGKQLDDGILTALDVEGLNLADVDLVVLSACETGLGQVAGGEGTLGLQRAFQIAGAQNVVASLWKVNDAATSALMRLFYTNLWVKHQAPAVALREAQLTLLHHPELCEAAVLTRGPNFDKVVKLAEGRPPARTAFVAPPSLWAAFVLSQSSLPAAEDSGR